MRAWVAYFALHNGLSFIHGLRQCTAHLLLVLQSPLTALHSVHVHCYDIVVVMDKGTMLQIYSQFLSKWHYPAIRKSTYYKHSLDLRSPYEQCLLVSDKHKRSGVENAMMQQYAATGNVLAPSQATRECRREMIAYNFADSFSCQSAF